MKNSTINRFNGKLKFEFHIAKHIREKYQLEDEYFSITGNVVFANFAAVRKFVNKINTFRDENTKLRVGEVNAAGLIDEIYHYILREYETKQNPGVFNKALNRLFQQFTEEEIEELLLDFVKTFPPLDVYKNRLSAQKYLEESTEGKPNKEIALEELILLYLSNINPANRNLKEFFDENYLAKKKTYSEAITKLDEFFKEETPFGPAGQSVLELLKTPILTHPESLWEQLRYLQSHWKPFLGNLMIRKILQSQDLMKEDVVINFNQFDAGGVPGTPPTIIPQYKPETIEEEYEKFTLGKSHYKFALDVLHEYEEPEKFTPDLNWMPNVIMIAKNTYVWLDQLSKKYGKEIKRLDQIPDEELEQLRKWNINGLWLIGIWERSPASKKIKHLMGNIDAVASAYSLYDYVIAEDLGGEEAYQNFNKRAKRKGIRLASDMVPNHTGIYSKWIVEHPEYFIQSKEPPFPNYKFTRENLSDDPRIQIRIEDSYYKRTDAAVVFQRIDNATGEIRYIYHGNDGTNMPWNDTAQLDMLKAEVREAVIEKIFEVARKFSIIRFDAAMTLTKKHFARLWYPEPGTGGDIPSRADYAMTKEEFDSYFPKEFWREVVDRINDEMPDTLLLAEAFWLMEGYFVRTLGMHRVYNSAFMNMLKNEENYKYKKLITNTLEFEPEILKRYVNFMSNPDEETAINQFGSSDKYFGVATLMVTLPGLPMFAHGQIEGYTEKYGMEYKRAYYRETPNDYLVKRHEREIFTLMEKRYVFSEVENFWYFEFTDKRGRTLDNVFAYFNSFGNEKALVFYNNHFSTVSGKIYHSTPKVVKGKEDKKKLRRKTVTDLLNIKPEKKYYYVYRDHNSKLFYLKSGREILEHGFEIDLRGFEYRVFWEFKEVYDDTGEYERLAESLKGKGVPNIEFALHEINLEPIHHAFENIFAGHSFDKFVENLVETGQADKTEDQNIKFLKNKFYLLLKSINDYYKTATDLKPYVRDFEHCLRGLRLVNPLIRKESVIKRKIRLVNLPKAIVISRHANYYENAIILLMFLIIKKIKTFLSDVLKKDETEYEKLLLGKPVKNLLGRLGKGENEIFRDILLLNILLRYNSDLFDVEKLYDEISLKSSIAKERKMWQQTKGKLILKILDDEDVRKFINVNEYEGIVYYSKERFEELLNWMFSVTICTYSIKKENELTKMKITDHSKKEIEKISPLELRMILLFAKSYYLYDFLKQASITSKYKLNELKEKVKYVGSTKSNGKKKPKSSKGVKQGKRRKSKK